MLHKFLFTYDVICFTIVDIFMHILGLSLCLGHNKTDAHLSTNKLMLQRGEVAWQKWENIWKLIDNETGLVHAEQIGMLVWRLAALCDALRTFQEQRIMLDG